MNAVHHITQQKLPETSLFYAPVKVLDMFTGIAPSEGDGIFDRCKHFLDSCFDFVFHVPALQTSKHIKSNAHLAPKNQIRQEQLVLSQLWNQKGKGGEVWFEPLGF